MLWRSLVTNCRSVLIDIKHHGWTSQPERISLHNIDGSTDLQAKRDKAFLEDYRRQAHEALAKDPYSTSFSEEPEIVHKNPVVRSTIKYKNQSPGDGSAFSASNQVKLRPLFTCLDVVCTYGSGLQSSRRPTEITLLPNTIPHEAHSTPA